jgi:hypothetical protein
LAGGAVLGGRLSATARLRNLRIRAVRWCGAWPAVRWRSELSFTDREYLMRLPWPALDTFSAWRRLSSETAFERPSWRPRLGAFDRHWSPGEEMAGRRFERASGAPSASNRARRGPGDTHGHGNHREPNLCRPPRRAPPPRAPRHGRLPRRPGADPREPRDDPAPVLPPVQAGGEGHRCRALASAGPAPAHRGHDRSRPLDGPTAGGFASAGSPGRTSPRSRGAGRARRPASARGCAVHAGRAAHRHGTPGPRHRLRHLPGREPGHGLM